MDVLIEERDGRVVNRGRAEETRRARNYCCGSILLLDRAVTLRTSVSCHSLVYRYVTNWILNLTRGYRSR